MVSGIKFPLLVITMLIVLAAACAPIEAPPTATPIEKELEITSRSIISGVVNDSVVEGVISARFNPDLGGSSTCTFSQLPEGFNPGTFGTHT